MTKIFAILIALAMLAIASPATTTQASETPDPLAAMDYHVFSERPTDHPGSEFMYCTSDDAVVVTSLVPLRENAYCTSGSHNPAIYSMGHGPDLATMAASGFTGFVESIVFYETGERRWTCSFNSGTWTGCAGTGGWPGQAVEYCHDVWAYDSQGVVSQPLFTGFTPGCTNGDTPEIAGLTLGSNSQPMGDGVPKAAWSAYTYHG